MHGKPIQHCSSLTCDSSQHPERTKSPSVHHENQLQIGLQGTWPGHNPATGFPVRSYHLSGLSEWTAVKGELLHHNQRTSIERFPPPGQVSQMPSVRSLGREPSDPTVRQPHRRRQHRPRRPYLQLRKSRSLYREGNAMPCIIQQAEMPVHGRRIRSLRI